MASRTTSLERRSLASTFGTVLFGDGNRLGELDRELVIALLEESGAVLLRGFASDDDDFVRFTGSITRDFSTYRGGGFRWGPLDRQSVDGNSTVMTVTGSGQGWPIPLHGEMYYLKQRPTLLWFYCRRASEHGGETTLCDGEAALDALPATTRDWLRSRNIKYVRELTSDEWPVTFQTADRGELEAICAANDLRLTVDDDGSIHTEFVCAPIVRSRARLREALINNIVQMYMIEWAFTSGWVKRNMPQLPRDRSPMVVRMEDGTKVPSAVFDDLRETFERLTVDVTWHQGDVLLVDNTRLLHGRRAATDPKRDIVVRMGEPAFEW